MHLLSQKITMKNKEVGQDGDMGVLGGGGAWL